MKDTLIDILRQEHREVEMQIAHELDRQDPDPKRLKELRDQAQDLRRQLERIPET
jgi:DNA-directed RNA polymerase specialized sigma24 family protein